VLYASGRLRHFYVAIDLLHLKTLTPLPPHSKYDSYFLLSNITDPGFAVHKVGSTLELENLVSCIQKDQNQGERHTDRADSVRARVARRDRVERRVSGSVCCADEGNAAGAVSRRQRRRCVANATPSSAFLLKNTQFGNFASVDIILYCDSFPSADPVAAPLLTPS
jgi:hypothetical protein